MQETATRKLPRGQRRDQLLEAAQAIVREEGTDALTLARLAERAGVSKPIAYDHFGTRSGLLIALYERLDGQQVSALHRALERTPRRLPDVAAVMSRAYVDCCVSAGPEWHAITAALKGDERMEAFQRELAERYVTLYRDALAAYADLPEPELRLRCVGILGAAEALSREMLHGRIGETETVAALASLMVAWLSAGPDRR